MKRTALLALALFTTPAAADPGHGMAGSLVHLLSELDHLAVLALLAGAAVFTFRRFRIRRSSRP